jgi:hypothetical protein
VSADSKACQQIVKHVNSVSRGQRRTKVLLERTIVLVFMSRYRGDRGGQLLLERTIALVFIIHFICFVQYASEKILQ